MTTKRFSVAMSVYKNDHPVFFSEALSSITEKQTIRPNEIVLVVDGPISGELAAAVNAAERDIAELKVIRLSENGGLGNALRIAVDNCSNELIARMDSDDLAVGDRFELQLEAFESNRNLDIVGSDISEFIASPEVCVGKRIVPKVDSEIKIYMKSRCPMNHMTVMFKKSSVLKSGGYLDWPWNEDYYLWLRMAEKDCVFANLDRCLVNVRVGEEMYQRRGGLPYFKSEKAIQDYMRKHGVINSYEYAKNIAIRFFLQVLMPNSMRGFIYKTFARG